LLADQGDRYGIEAKSEASRVAAELLSFNWFGCRGRSSRYLPHMRVTGVAGPREKYAIESGRLLAEAVFLPPAA